MSASTRLEAQGLGGFLSSISLKSIERLSNIDRTSTVVLQCEVVRRLRQARCRSQLNVIFFSRVVAVGLVSY